MKNRKNNILLWAAALLPFLMVAAIWARLPVQVPTHWGFSGSADQYSPRWVLWMLALICLLMAFFPKADPKSGNYQKFRGSYWVFQFAMALFLDALMALTLLETLRPGTVNISVAMQLFIAVLLMVVGNMMPKFRQTYFCGIKTPWTLASESGRAPIGSAGGCISWRVSVYSREPLRSRPLGLQCCLQP